MSVGKAHVASQRQHFAKSSSSTEFSSEWHRLLGKRPSTLIWASALGRISERKSNSHVGTFSLFAAWGGSRVLTIHSLRPIDSVNSPWLQTVDQMGANLFQTTWLVPVYIVSLVTSALWFGGIAKHGELKWDILLRRKVRGGWSRSPFCLESDGI